MRTIELECKPWKLTGEGVRLGAEPIAGTWTLTPPELKDVVAHRGLLSCPNCASPQLIPGSEVQQDVDQDKIPFHFLDGFHCVCGLNARLVLKQWDSKKLYCIAYETQAPGEHSPIIAEKDYLHAENQLDATTQFWAGRRHSDNVRQVVGVAPVIGYFVNDVKGDKLTV